MVVGAPLTALACRSWPRRGALLFFLGVFVAVHVVGALTPSYGVLLATRVVGALANAGFWAVALVTALALVSPHQRARATAVVVGGVTLACVVGVPAGAALGELWGWRSAFWAVALVSLLGRDRPAGGRARRHARRRADGERQERTARPGPAPAAADAAGHGVRAGRDLLHVLLSGTAGHPGDRPRSWLGPRGAGAVRRRLVRGCHPGRTPGRRPPGRGRRHRHDRAGHAAGRHWR